MLCASSPLSSSPCTISDMTFTHPRGTPRETPSPVGIHTVSRAACRTYQIQDSIFTHELNLAMFTWLNHRDGQQQACIYLYGNLSSYAYRPAMHGLYGFRGEAFLTQCGKICISSTTCVGENVKILRKFCEIMIGPSTLLPEFAWLLRKLLHSPMKADIFFNTVRTCWAYCLPILPTSITIMRRRSSIEPPLP